MGLMPCFFPAAPIISTPTYISPPPPFPSPPPSLFSPSLQSPYNNHLTTTSPTTTTILPPTPSPFSLSP